MRFRAHVCGALVMVALSARAARADGLPSPLTREAVLARVIDDHPRVQASRRRAEALDQEADATNKLPSPELDFEIWQVPFTRPYALDRAGMMMLGLRQRFPALGSLGARADAVRADAAVERAAADDQARVLKRDAGHAFVDYWEARERARTHQQHVAVAQRILTVSRAWYVSGGSAAEVAQAEIDLAQMQAELAADEVLAERTQARLDAAMRLPIDTPLGEPTVAGTAPSEDLPTLLARAHAQRAELRAVRAAEDAAEARRVAAKREWLVPSFSVGALYFPPTGAATEHAFGMSVTVELPWLWGAGKNRSDAGRSAVQAAALTTAGARVGVDVEVAEAFANVQTQAARLRLLEQTVLPATRRALDITLTAYVAARSDFALLLASRRAVIDADLNVVTARAQLEHAIVDLEGAVGAGVVR